MERRSPRRSGSRPSPRSPYHYEGPEDRQLDASYDRYYNHHSYFNPTFYAPARPALRSPTPLYHHRRQSGRSHSSKARSQSHGSRRSLSRSSHHSHGSTRRSLHGRGGQDERRNGSASRSPRKYRRDESDSDSDSSASSSESSSSSSSSTTTSSSSSTDAHSVTNSSSSSDTTTDRTSSSSAYDTDATSSSSSTSSARRTSTSSRAHSRGRRRGQMRKRDSTGQRSRSGSHRTADGGGESRARSERDEATVAETFRSLLKKEKQLHRMELELLHEKDEFTKDVKRRVLQNRGTADDYEALEQVERLATLSQDSAEPAPGVGNRVGVYPNRPYMSAPTTLAPGTSPVATSVPARVAVSTSTPSSFVAANAAAGGPVTSVPALSVSAGSDIASTAKDAPLSLDKAAIVSVLPSRNDVAGSQVMASSQMRQNAAAAALATVDAGPGSAAVGRSRSSPVAGVTTQGNNDNNSNADNVTSTAGATSGSTMLVSQPDENGGTRKVKVRVRRHRSSTHGHHHHRSQSGATGVANTLDRTSRSPSYTQLPISSLVAASAGRPVLVNVSGAANVSGQVDGGAGVGGGPQVIELRPLERFQANRSTYAPPPPGMSLTQALSLRSLGTSQLVRDGDRGNAMRSNRDSSVVPVEFVSGRGRSLRRSASAAPPPPPSPPNNNNDTNNVGLSTSLATRAALLAQAQPRPPLATSTVIGQVFADPPQASVLPPVMLPAAPEQDALAEELDDSVVAFPSPPRGAWRDPNAVTLPGIDAAGNVIGGDNNNNNNVVVVQDLVPIQAIYECPPQTRRDPRRVCGCCTRDSELWQGVKWFCCGPHCRIRCDKKNKKKAAQQQQPVVMQVTNPPSNITLC